MRRGFTLIELLVVMAIIATLLSIALPRYFGSLDRAKEATLRQSLSVMREAIDRFQGDQGRCPQSLAELAERRYLKAVPVDPITQSEATWVVSPPPPGSELQGEVYDVHSGAPGNAGDGRAFASF